MLFETTLQISPFAGVRELVQKVRVAIQQWWDKTPKKPFNSGTQWKFKGGSEIWSRYTARKQSTYTDYVPVHVVGVQENSILETESYEGPDGGPPFLTPPAKKSSVGGWEMTLAAGGTIQQTIKADSCPEQWDWEAAELINVQLLNTVAFESLTGLAPPPSPISFLEYSKAGVPSMTFYQADALSTATLRTDMFSMVRTIGEIDDIKGVEYGVRMSSNGSLVGCVVCERSLCDAV